MIEVQKNNGLISKFTVTACTEVLKTKKAQEMLNAILENTSEHKLFVAPVSPSEENTESLVELAKLTIEL